MAIKDRAVAFSKKFKLDSHHAIERFGLFFGALMVTGALVLATSGFSAFMAGRGDLGDTALWTPEFRTSKTQLGGKIDGVYTNGPRTKALVLMHFDDRAKISYNAADYRAFLLGSDERFNSQTLATRGVDGSFHVFGSTGYVGVLLQADEPFHQQVLNLTVRANAELSFNEQQAESASTDDIIGDKSFAEHDQWRVFVNPGANKTTTVKALDAARFDPAQIFYEVVLKSAEDTARKALDDKLIEMRTNLSQITAYGNDLSTTRVDGLFLRPPKVPAMVSGDAITGESAPESTDGKSSLALTTKTVVPGGFALDWRPGNVYDGYLDVLVPPGESYVQYLSKKANEGSGANDSASVDINAMTWILSDGSSLVDDYKSSDVSMRPLVTVMNNLSQAYQDYYSNKSEYQSDLTLALLQLDLNLRDVQSNSSANSGEGFLVTYY
ncbi:hypothetical protein ACFOY4_01755 [Actinomadura syzygii]|uniref:Uncharacterized protein n=1 Tax=Actinomadura syzygii TaxID=1427538 RepID=A0A5D0TTA4_9ACTN|nr:hypothetical protein [Actinomadura syzygii]TYC08535.1 hypothetical protein FXF65_37190 [Actinomadura syzygii]